MVGDLPEVPWTGGQKPKGKVKPKVKIVNVQPSMRQAVKRNEGNDVLSEIGQELIDEKVQDDIEYSDSSVKMMKIKDEDFVKQEIEQRKEVFK